MTIRKCLTLLSLLVVVPVCTACNQQPSYSTPEECFNAFVKAEQEDDAATLLSCMTMPKRNQMVGSLAWGLHVVSTFGENAPGLDETSKGAAELLKKYGFEKAKFKEMQGMSLRSKEFASALEQMGAGVSDQIQFVEDVSELRRKNKDREKKKPEELPQLVDVKIDGDTATGKVKAPGSQVNPPISFIKEDRTWRISSQPQSE